MKKYITIEIDCDLHKDLKKISKKEKHPFNDLCELALENYRSLHKRHNKEVVALDKLKSAASFTLSKL